MMRKALLALVRGWQLTFGAWMGPVCRYEPSCSVYAAQALQRHGALAGAYLAAHRVVRCGPWCAGGSDPVPADKPRLFTHLSTSLHKKNS